VVSLVWTFVFCAGSGVVVVVVAVVGDADGACLGCGKQPDSNMALKATVTFNIALLTNFIGYASAESNPSLTSAESNTSMRV